MDTTDDSQPLNWVWYSTPDSRASGQISILALVETILCVIAYWVLWLWLGVTWHHWLILIATPLVLMRSEASVKKGVKWFDRFWGNRGSVPLGSVLGIALVCLSIVMTYSLLWALGNLLLTGHSGLALAFRAVGVGLFAVCFAWAIVEAGMGETSAAIFASVVGLISGAQVVTETGIDDGIGIFILIAAAWLLASLGGVKSVPGMGLAAGIWLRAVLTRIASTSCHPVAGMHFIPRNWRQLVWIDDLFAPIELVPSHEDSRLSELGPSNSARGKASKASKKFLFIISEPLIFIMVFILFTPTLLWRWAIKSTAWFYLPLLWVGRGWQNINGKLLTTWAKAYATTWLNRVGLCMAIVGLAASAFALFLPLEFLHLSARLDAAGAPMSPIGYLLVLDWPELLHQPWKICFLLSWGLTLALFFMLDHHAKHIEKGADPAVLTPTFRRWMWVSNARTVLTNLGLLIALHYFLQGVGAYAQINAILN